jgi:hypothetical protein
MSKQDKFIWRLRLSRPRVRLRTSNNDYPVIFGCQPTTLPLKSARTVDVAVPSGTFGVV